ncbi:MAG TPA: polyprenyl diphosphate synthase [Terriglobales bacterium]|jgi:undecaprenyl diphosphate synthase
MQSTLHVGIIMDGNGRWARAREWPRARGHLAGVEAVRRVVRAAPRQGVGALTLYVFSSDNWRRPSEEVETLFALLCSFLESERPELVRMGVRCTAIGRRDRMPAAALASLESIEAATAEGRGLRLRLAIDYSARGEMARAAAAAAARWTPGLPPDPSLMRRLMAETLEGDAGPLDLLIRTGGERRLSDFMLWEAAYAELYLTRVCWPEFDAVHLRRALRSFARRERKFGAVTGTRLVEAARA